MISYSYLFESSLALRERAEQSITMSLMLQLQEALLTCGISMDLREVNIFNPSAEDKQEFADLHDYIRQAFTATLSTYQGHFRAIEKIQKQMQQPVAKLRKDFERMEELKQKLKNASEEARQKLEGQLGAARGVWAKGQERVEELQAQVDAEFEAARAAKPAFLAIRRADEYTRRLFQVMEKDTIVWGNPDLARFQNDITVTNLWNPHYQG